MKTPYQKVKNGRKRRKFNSDFKPTRQYIEQSVDDYLRNGGKITKIINENLEDINPLETPSDVSVDDFLMGV